MATDPLRIIVFGAHPDDCDFKVGGIARLYVKKGHRVKFVSVTSGNSGHFAIGGAPLATRRRAEMAAAARLAGVEFEIFDINDGALEPTLANRLMVIRAIREFAPDIVITHRPNDYHPDHRYTSVLVQDASYMVTVPNVLPLTPHLAANPVVAYMSDDFKKPSAFTADVVVDIEPVLADRMKMLACHESQMFEWLPYNWGLTDVPSDAAARLKWVTSQFAPDNVAIARRFRATLRKLYGPARGARVKYAEALEFCEYGAPVTKKNFHTLFPFFKK